MSRVPTGGDVDLNEVCKATGIYTVNNKEFDCGYEVHADGGRMLTIHVDTAGAAKRIARNVWNNGMSQQKAEHLEYYGDES